MDRLGGSTAVLPAINHSHPPSNPSLGPIRRLKDLAEALIKQQLTSHWPGFRATETVSVHPPIFVRFDQSCGLRHWRLRHQAFSQGKLAMPELMYSRPNGGGELLERRAGLCADLRAGLRHGLRPGLQGVVPTIRLLVG
jgi:hypothetical protein